MISQERQDIVSSLEKEISKISNSNCKENLEELLKNYKESGDESILRQI